MEGAITAAVALIGVALATLGFWRDFPDLRSRRYSERFKGLLEMSDELTARGPYAGPGATATSTTTHEAMLSGLDLEARANAVMYMSAAGRLRRPGSMNVAAGMVVYGVVIAYFVFASVLPATPANEPVSVMTTVSQYILLGIGASRSALIEWNNRDSRSCVRKLESVCQEVQVQLHGNTSRQRCRHGRRAQRRPKRLVGRNRSSDDVSGSRRRASGRCVS